MSRRFRIELTEPELKLLRAAINDRAVNFVSFDFRVNARNAALVVYMPGRRPRPKKKQPPPTLAVSRRKDDPPTTGAVRKEGT